MALKDPATVDGAECILGSVEPINDFIDDLGWWRANLRSSDDFRQVAARMPIDDEHRTGLVRDMERIGPLGEELFLSAVRIAMTHGTTINVDWSETGPASISAQMDIDGNMAIMAFLDCKRRP